MSLLVKNLFVFLFLILLSALKVYGEHPPKFNATLRLANVSYSSFLRDAGDVLPTESLAEQIEVPERGTFSAYTAIPYFLPRAIMGDSEHIDLITRYYKALKTIEEENLTPEDPDADLVSINLELEVTAINPQGQWKLLLYGHGATYGKRSIDEVSWNVGEEVDIHQILLDAISRLLRSTKFDATLRHVRISYRSDLEDAGNVTFRRSLANRIEVPDKGTFSAYTGVPPYIHKTIVNNPKMAQLIIRFYKALKIIEEGNLAPENPDADLINIHLELEVTKDNPQGQWNLYLYADGANYGKRSLERISWSTDEVFNVNQFLLDHISRLFKEDT